MGWRSDANIVHNGFRREVQTEQPFGFEVVTSTNRKFTFVAEKSF